MNRFGEFTLILPVYHGDKYEFFVECFESVLGNTLQPAEIIVVFDGKVDVRIDDYLSNIQKNVERLIIKKLPQNVGLPAALNIAIDESSFDVVCRMDADDVCDKDRFLIQWTEFSDKHYDLLGTGIIEFEKNPHEPSNVRQYPTSSAQIRRYLSFRNAFAHPTVMFKKNKYYEAGGYCSNDKYFEDWGLWLRMAKITRSVGNLEQPLVKMRANIEQLQRRRGIRYLYYEWNFFMRYYRSNHLKMSSFLYLLFIRTPIRIIPITFLKFIYKNRR